MNSPIIDSHCHLDHYANKGALDEVFQLCEEHQVGKLISVGTDGEDWAVYRDMAEKYREIVYYSVGMHPTSVEEGWEKWVSQIESFFSGNVKPCALGEIGLDYFHLPKDEAEREIIIARQKEAFIAQLEIAKQLDCPIIIHSREAFKDCLTIIDESGVDWSKVVYHCFSEGADQIAQLNERGGRGSFTGIITYKSAQYVRDTALEQGLDKIMVETDAPYLTPVPHRGKPNQPAFTRFVAKYCAELFGISEEEFSKISYQNTCDFYGI